MQNGFRSEILKFRKSGKKLINKHVLNIFKEKSELPIPFIKKFSSAEHFCSFFLPIDVKSGTIYLVDHIKAKMWIPPGGHIEEGESPRDAVFREFVEELSYALEKEKIELFDLSITPIADPNRTCKIHYDFWYAVFIPQQDFRFEKKEFHGTRWFSFEEALYKIKSSSFKTIIGNLLTIY